MKVTLEQGCVLQMNFVSYFENPALLKYKVSTYYFDIYSIYLFMYYIKYIYLLIYYIKYVLNY